MKSPLNIDLSAKASAKLTATVPQKATGRLVDALTDIIRPFSEQRGLRADQIRYQREEVMIEVAKLARTRLAIEKAKITPVDLKILIPLLEKSSLEDPNDSEMIEKWSSLLSSAASGVSVQPRFVQILSELSSKQAHLLRDIGCCHFDNVRGNEKPFVNSHPTHLLTSIFFGLPKLESEFDCEMLMLSAAQEFRRPGVRVWDIKVSSTDWARASVLSETSTLHDENQKKFIDIEILVSLGLLRFFNDKITNEFARVEVSCHYLTSLGLAFLTAIDSELCAARRGDISPND